MIAACTASGCAVGLPEEPTNVTTSGVTLNARVSTSSGGEVTHWFRYGTSSSYGSETPPRTAEMAANSSRQVSEPIPITAGTEYHWQVCTQDDDEDPPRTNCSKDQTLYVGPVSCNPITRNTWVTNNLANCAPSIGAAGIALHLQGHTFGGVIQNNGFDGVTIEGGTVEGVLLTDARDNRVRDLTVIPEPGSTTNALRVLGDSAGTVVADNESYAVAIAMLLNSPDLRVLRNTVSGIGLTSTDKEGPLVVQGANNYLEGNRATLEASDGIGRGIGKGSILIYGDGAVLVNNVANDSPTWGIVIMADNAQLIGNTANSNSQGLGSVGAGIQVQATSTSLRDNTANFNDGLGIEAPTGVTDLGGNRAQGNSNPLQCTGVVCQP